MEVKFDGVVDRQDQESVANLDVDGAALVQGGCDEAILFEAVWGAPVGVIIRGLRAFPSRRIDCRRQC